MTKFIFVVGGVMSGVGKGTTTASIGKILQHRGYKVTATKIDPYINVDAGTMNPVEHGEVFVTVDGEESDQDLGSYERFLDIEMGKVNYMTTGRVYQSVIERERSLGYGGKCVQVVPHVPEEIIGRIKRCAKVTGADVVMVEIGGTVGEYENILFLEAARMMKLEHPRDVIFALVSYMPIPSTLGEMKTKPTQHAARTLNASGIQPDFIFCRGSKPLDEPRKRKLAVGCNINPEDLFSAPDASNVYEVPVIFEDESVGDRFLKKLGLRTKKNTFREWRNFTNKLHRLNKTVKIGVVGKYFSTGDFVLSDAYLSVIESLKHAAWFFGAKPELTWLNAEELEEEGTSNLLKGFDGLLIPGGWGARGIEGKIKAIQYAREKKIPYLGLCYGMQLAVVEYARHVLGWKDANTTEVDPKTTHPVIHIMQHQQSNLAGQVFGGTSRLGGYRCLLKYDSKARDAYGKSEIVERHRHRYELNNDFRDALEKAGLMVSGTSPDGQLAEIIELPKHPFFIGAQFHPEFTSRPNLPQPLFKAFIKAALKK
ncbi:MAG: CTP synthase [bacterium]